MGAILNAAWPALCSTRWASSLGRHAAAGYSVIIVGFILERLPALTVAGQVIAMCMIHFARPHDRYGWLRHRRAGASGTIKLVPPSLQC
jgi:hypothetical protein